MANKYSGGLTRRDLIKGGLAAGGAAALGLNYGCGRTPDDYEGDKWHWEYRTFRGIGDYVVNNAARARGEWAKRHGLKGIDRLLKGPDHGSMQEYWVHKIMEKTRPNA